MCGITGYVGKNKHAIKVLLTGLKNLEYRGYDSAGVAYLDKDELKIVKSVGPIKNLEEKLDNNIESHLGIGHTRWATHGRPSEKNSHPHSVGKIAIVHNGIIENYGEIKEELISNGYTFNSETDTEVACALLDYLYKNNDIKNAIKIFQERVRGSYAIVLYINGENDSVYVIKNASPLIIGIGEGENFIASDVPAILEYTSKYIALEDGDFAKVSADEIELYDKKAKDKEYKIKEFSGDASIIDKKGYDHFMLKEIHEQPDIAKNLIMKYIDNNELGSLPDLTRYDNVYIVACGSAMHAGLVGKYLIESNLNIPVIVEYASEFRYKKLFLNNKTLVIAVSQSGETADTLAAVKIAREHGAHTLGIVNVKESSIARETDEVIYTEAGSEIAVATTKAYLAQVLIFILLAIKNNKIIEDYSKLPLYMEHLINDDNTYNRIAKDLYENENIFFIGRQRDYALCMEGSLKLKEISYIHSEAYAAGELKHGTISLITEGTPVFAVITEENIAEKTISNAKEVKARGANVILIITKNLDIDGDFYDEKIVIPDMNEFTPLLAIIPLQLIAYKIANLRGCSIDKPKNLAKSVTVE